MTLERVRAVVRIRPLNDRERGLGYVPLIDRLSATQIQVGEAISDSEKQFVFDGIFGPSCTQDILFRECGIQQMLNHVLEGYSATIFAYGQTGSGKTFTMSGDDSQFQNGRFKPAYSSGLVPRSLTYLVNRIEVLRRTNATSTFTMQASFVEIYNEVPRDLLSPGLNAGKSNLILRLGPDGAFFIENQIVVDCQTHEDLMAVFTQGFRNRHVGSHDINSDSSRSHSIMTVTIRAASADSSCPILGKVSFVDLAGSERIRDSKSSGEVMLRETSNINRSLFLLGKVISALGSKPLSTSKTRPGCSHIPYRDSLLTKLLMDSLGGSGKTLMIACLSPASQHVKESLSTLFYATRARQIQNCPIKRIEGPTGGGDKVALTELRQQTDSQEKEIRRLRAILARFRIDPDSDLSSNLAPEIPPSSAAIMTRPYGPRVQMRPRSEQLPPIPQTPRFMAPPQVTTALGVQIQGLLKENVGLQDARQEQHKKILEVISENERLTEKVRNLERIFIEDKPEIIPLMSGKEPQSGNRRSSDSFQEPVAMTELLALRRTNLRLRVELEKRDRTLQAHLQSLGKAPSHP